MSIPFRNPPVHPSPRTPWNRPILYLKDEAEAAAAGDGGSGSGNGDLRMQDEWDEREMGNRRQARRRAAEDQAAAEIRLWGCETDAAGAPLSAEEGGGAAASAAARAGFVPFEPACDEGWQVRWEVPALRLLRAVLFCSLIHPSDLHAG